MQETVSAEEKDITRNPDRKLGIVAGGGELPKRLIDWCRAHNRPYYALAIHANADEKIFTKDVAHEWIRIGQAGTGFKRFKEEGVKEIVLIGTIKRPTFPNWCRICAPRRFCQTRRQSFGR